MKAPTLPGFEAAISTEEDLLAEAEALLEAGLKGPDHRDRYRDLMRALGCWHLGEGWEQEARAVKEMRT